MNKHLEVDVYARAEHTCVMDLHRPHGLGGSINVLRNVRLLIMQTTSVSPSRDDLTGTAHIDQTVYAQGALIPFILVWVDG